ncbi:hypothetical protein RHMOL_Rhmol08G0157300 [Rhododendron molle]|uniref:Uncharacterized protein n=1 Tax=Rhododendron molle TaxID=49168 RepID=A0ACC0MQ37_RHOML|nr:hypothetical protein RHMOL_Rhmol08G0157300 [Rhododendron molle]
MDDRSYLYSPKSWPEFIMDRWFPQICARVTKTRRNPMGERERGERGRERDLIGESKIEINGNTW